MEKVELDLTRPFGVIYGDPKYAYEQDGLHFKPDGTADRWCTPEQIAKEAALALKRKQKELKVAQIREAAQARKKLLEDLN